MRAPPPPTTDRRAESRAAPPAPGDGATAAVCAALSIAVTLAVVSFSASWGKLAWPSTYDDCGYIRTAVLLADELFEEGPAAMARLYASQSVLSPGFAVLGVASVLLFGKALAGFYLMNAVTVFLWLLLVARVLGPLAFRHRLPWLLVSALVPLPLTGVYQLHPDVAAAVLVAWAAWLALERAGAAFAWRREIPPVLFLCAALFFKPSTLPLSCAVYGAAAAVRILARPGERLATLGRSAALHAAALAALALLLWNELALHTARAFTVLVEQRDVYHAPEAPFDPLFPLRGIVEQASLGVFRVLAAGVLLLAALRWRRAAAVLREERALWTGWALAALVAYAIPVAVSSVAGYRQAFPLHALLFTGMFHLAAKLTAGGDRRDAGAASPARGGAEAAAAAGAARSPLAWSGLLALAVAVPAFQFPRAHVERNPRLGAAYVRLQDEIVGYVAESARGSPLTVGVTFSAAINRATLRLAFTLAGHRQVRVAPIDEHFSTEASVARALAGCQLVLAASPPASHLAQDLPINRLAAWSFALLEADPELVRAASFEAGELSITAFRRAAAGVPLLADDAALSGFDRLESTEAGPGEELPVRWNREARVAVRYDSPAPARARLLLSCRYFGADEPPRRILVRAGGREQELVLPDGRGWHAFATEIDLAEGETEIGLELPGAEPGRKWILFRRIDLATTGG